MEEQLALAHRVEIGAARTRTAVRACRRARPRRPRRARTRRGCWRGPRASTSPRSPRARSRTPTCRARGSRAGPAGSSRRADHRACSYAAPLPARYRAARATVARYIAPVPSELGSPTLRLTRAQYERSSRTATTAFPKRRAACSPVRYQIPGSGDETTGEVTAVYPCENAAHSARIYRVGGEDLMRATLDANRRDEEIIAVWHSHTHTDAYPSPHRRRAGDGGSEARAAVALPDREPQVRRAGAARLLDPRRRRSPRCP